MSASPYSHSPDQLPSGHADAASSRRYLAKLWSKFGASFLILVALLALVALAGGASRMDSLGQVVVRAASVVALIALVLSRAVPDVRALRPVLAFVAAVVVVVALQLVPLPPAVWSALPGHGFYADAANAAGIAQPWRPISVSPDRTWNALFALLPAVAVAIALACVSRRERGALVPVLVVLVIASAVLGLAQITDGPESALRWYEFNTADSAEGFFANRNHQALLLAMGFPLLAHWATRERSRKRPRRSRDTRGWFAAGLGAFLLLAIPATGSRAGLVLGAVALLVTALFVIRPIRDALRPMRSRKRWTIYGVGAALVLGCLALALTFGRATAVQRLSLLDAETDPRLRVIPTAIEIIKAFFPVGSGFGSFDPVYRRFEPFDTLSGVYMNQAHNDFLQVVLEGGIAAAALLAIFVLWWLVQSFRLWRQPRDFPYVMQGRVGSAMLGLLMLASVTDYPARTPLMLVVAVIAAAWMCDFDGAKRRGASQ